MRLRVVMGLALGLCLSYLPLFAQLDTGRISGGITDQSGGAIAGATVTVTDVARGESRALTADSDGLYAAPNLTPGIYTVRAEFKGFQTVQRQNIELGVGGDVRVDLTLQPGEQTQTVTVTEALPLVDTTNAETGGALETEVLANLPVNGRNYRNAISFAPGGGTIQLPGGGTGFGSTNGTSGYGVNYMVDGLYDESPYTREASAGGESEGGDTTLMPLDAIQEVELITNPKAEYGFVPGLTLSVGLKSGTNDMHGSAYAFGRDEAFDTKDAFATAREPLAFEQWGGTLGGPIKKNKLFYFLGYESERIDATSTFQLTAPTTAPGLGTSNSIPDAIAAINKDITAGVHGAQLSQLSLNLSGCGTVASLAGITNSASIQCNGNQYGFPSLWSNFSTTSTTVTNNFPDYGGSDNGVAKLDYHLNDHHTLGGFFYYGNYKEYTSPSLNATILQPYWSDLVAVASPMGHVVEIWTPNSAMVNEARFGVDHSSRPVVRAECAATGNTSNPLGQGATPGNDGGPVYSTAYDLVSGAPACGVPSLSLSGFTGTVGGGNDREETDTDIQGAESLSYTRGTHQLKFGTDVRAEKFMGAKTTTTQVGAIGFGAANIEAFSGATPLESFLAGVPSSESIEYGNAVRTVAWDQIALFAQDDWRILRRLTLNLGLRWEIQTPANANGLLGNFDPASPTGMSQGNPLWPTQSDPSPHVGLVWDVTGKGRTVVRASEGMAYGMTLLSSFLSGNTNYSAVPTGAVLYNTNGSTIAPTGTINNVGVAITPVAAGSPGVVTGVNAVPWAAGTSLFSTKPAACGNGLAPVNPVAGAPAVNPPTCTGNGGNSNLMLPKDVDWNLTVQQALTNNLSLTVSYVGTHTEHDLGYYDLNEPTPGASGSVEQGRRPYATEFPWFAAIYHAANFGVNNYNGLQMNLTERASHGLTFSVNYAYANNLGNGSGPGSLTEILNSLNPNMGYGHAGDDIHDHFTITANYKIPGRNGLGQLLQGWALNVAVNALSGQTISATDSSFDTSGTGEKIDRWTLYGPTKPFDQIFGGAGTIPCYGLSTSKLVTASGSPCIVVAAAGNFPAACIAGATGEAPGPAGVANNTGLLQLSNIGCYSVNGSAIVPPAQGTYGTMYIGELNGPAFYNVDASVTKDWKIKERLTTEFRAEAFNLLNRADYAGGGTNYGSPSTFGKSTSTPDVAKGNEIFGSGGPREIQLGLKLIF